MRDKVLHKMKACATEWVCMKKKQDVIKSQRGDAPIKGYNLHPLTPHADFHDHFFNKFEEEFSAFDKHTRRFLFHMVYTNLEFWESGGLCSWAKYRLLLTPEGETVFGAHCE